MNVFVVIELNIRLTRVIWATWQWLNVHAL